MNRGVPGKEADGLTHSNLPDPRGAGCAGWCRRNPAWRLHPLQPVFLRGLKSFPSACLLPHRASFCHKRKAWPVVPPRPPLMKATFIRPGVGGAGGRGTRIAVGVGEGSGRLGGGEKTNRQSSSRECYFGVLRDLSTEGYLLFLLYSCRVAECSY